MEGSDHEELPASTEDSLIALHQDAVESHHRFDSVTFRESVWDLTHLDAFAFRHEISTELTVDVVVLFACHCFTHEMKHDPRERIPYDEWYQDQREKRVLDEQRYSLSKRYLREVVTALPSRQIRIVSDRPNFMTVDVVDAGGNHVNYAVFFELTKDSRRKKRLILRVQSAYALEDLSRRQRDAEKINFRVLAKAVYERRVIRG